MATASQRTGVRRHDDLGEGNTQGADPRNEPTLPANHDLMRHFGKCYQIPGPRD